MRILLLIFAIHIYSFQVSGASSTPQELCPSEFTTKTLVKDWRKDSATFDRESEGFCADVICANKTTHLTRRKCLNAGESENTIKVTYQDGVREDNLYSSRGRYFEVMLHESEECFDACTPVAKSIIGLRVKNEVGLDRESCRTCFTKRKDFELDGSFFYKEIGKKIYPGQKCFNTCRDPKGAILMSHSPSLACRQCMGINGQPGEKFHYLLSKENLCFEIDSDQVKRLVPNHFCAPSKRLISTILKAKKGGNFLFGYTEVCEEIDEKTEGRIYKKNIPFINCRSEAIENSDRSIVEDDATETKPSSSEKTSSKQ